MRPAPHRTIPPKNWSNLSFLVPLLLALHYRMYVYASCIAVMMIFSVLYHLYDEQAYGRFDRTAAIALMLFNFSVSYLAHFPEPYTALAILFVIIAFTFYFTNNEHRYELHHSAWHVSSAIITCLCIAAYATVL